MRTALDLLLSLCACAVVEGLRVTKVDVPRYLVVGQKARLKCHFTLEGEVLYSLKWWKDGSQFYQFIPRNDPRMVVFTVTGVHVNVEHSNLHQVELLDVQSTSNGVYRCEVVAEAPTFTTHDMASNMTIVDPPDGPPKVHGLESSYRDGDLVRLNCTSYRSRPPPMLSWAVERVKARASGGYTTHFTLVDEQHLVRYPPRRAWREEHILAPHRRTYSSTLGLILTAQRRLAPHGLFKLRCISVVHEYEWVTEVTVRVEKNPVVEPHHLPTLLNTGAAVTASADNAVSSALLTNFAIIVSGFVHCYLP